MEFSGAAEGLGYNDEALKDLFNSALDEPLSWWRMSGLDHLTFGEFVESLTRSPAKVAGVPQVVGDKANSPMKSSTVVLEAMVAITESAPEPAPPCEAHAVRSIPRKEKVTVHPSSCKL